MKTRIPFLRLSLSLAAMAWTFPCHGDDQNHASIPKNFKTSALVAWCIVPFDAQQRDAQQRASMVRRLGLQRVAYDWRAEHVPKFEQEILAYQKHGIEYFAFWNWHDEMEALIKKHQIKPQLWRICKAPREGSDEDKVASAVRDLMPIVEKTKNLGLKLGLYNHGGWSGEPKNMVAICESLRRDHAADHVGIVYNFHHGHGHINDFAEHLELMTPYLLCVNLNGMMDAEAINANIDTNKIASIGSGVHEHAMIKTLMASDYRGPIGVIGHRKEMDVEQVLRSNIDGLNRIVKESATGTH